MGFRHPLTAADPITVDTGGYDLLTPGVRLYQGEEFGADPDLGPRPIGVLEMRTGVAGDEPATMKLTSLQTSSLLDPEAPDSPVVTEVLGSDLRTYAGAVNDPYGLVPGPDVHAMVEEDPTFFDGRMRSRWTLHADVIELNGQLTGSAVARPRAWNFARSAHTNNAQDSYTSANGMTTFIDGTIGNAPAGDYLLVLNLVLSATAGTAGFCRWTIGGSVPLGDVRADLTTTREPLGALPYALNWAGGNLRVTAAHSIVSAGVTGTIHTNGSLVSIVYLGPRS